MSARAVLRLAFATEADARVMADALAPENGAWLRTRVEGATLVCEAEAEAPLSLLHTLDDALACLSAAEKAARSGRAAQPRPRED